MDTAPVMPLMWPEGWVLYWPIVVEIIKALALPVVGLLGLLLALSMLRAAGGSIEAFGTKVSVAQRQMEQDTKKLSADMDQSIREEAAQSDGTQPAPAITAERPNFTNSVEAISQGWALIDQATREVLKAVNAPPHIAGYLTQNATWAFDWLALERWIRMPLRDTIKSLVELRTSAMDAHRRGASILTEDAAREFHIAAQKAAKAILNAVNYRLRKRQDDAQPAAS